MCPGLAHPLPPAICSTALEAVGHLEVAQDPFIQISFAGASLPDWCRYPADTALFFPQHSFSPNHFCCCSITFFCGFR